MLTKEDIEEIRKRAKLPITTQLLELIDRMENIITHGSIDDMQKFLCEYYGVKYIEHNEGLNENNH
jgi:molecular chaperone GrpE (heat shock protein)